MKRLLTLVTIITLLASCHPQKRISRLLDKHPGIAAVECESRFPVLETTDTLIVVDSSALEMYEKEFQYLTAMIDSILSSGCDTVTVEKIKWLKSQMPEKPCQETIVRITKESTAKLEIHKSQFAAKEKEYIRQADSLQKKIESQDKALQKTEEQLADAMEKNHKLRGQRNDLFWLLLLAVAFIFRKPLWSLGKKGFKAIRLLISKV